VLVQLEDEFVAVHESGIGAPSRHATVVALCRLLGGGPASRRDWDALSHIADLQAEHSKVFEESLEELGFTVRKCTQVA
jgi:hypothetical protein